MTASNSTFPTSQAPAGVSPQEKIAVSRSVSPLSQKQPEMEYVGELGHIRRRVSVVERGIEAMRSSDLFFKDRLAEGRKQNEEARKKRQYQLEQNKIQENSFQKENEKFIQQLKQASDNNNRKELINISKQMLPLNETFEITARLAEKALDECKKKVKQTTAELFGLMVRLKAKQEGINDLEEQRRDFVKRELELLLNRTKQLEAPKQEEEKKKAIAKKRKQEAALVNAMRSRDENCDCTGFIEYLLKTDEVDPNIRCLNDEKILQDEKSQPVLQPAFIAVIENDLDALQLLMSGRHKVDLTARNAAEMQYMVSGRSFKDPANSHTLLTVATAEYINNPTPCGTRQSIIEFLLEQGAKPEDGLTVGIQGGNVDLVRFFLEKGADPSLSTESASCDRRVSNANRNTINRMLQEAAASRSRAPAFQR